MAYHRAPGDAEMIRSRPDGGGGPGAVFALAGLLLCLVAAARAEEPLRLPIQFDASLSVQVLDAAKRWGAQWIARGKASGQPVVLRMVTVESVELISLQSPAVCDRVKGCPLLVFHGIDKPPVLISNSFENILERERPDGIELILRSDGAPDRACLVTRAARASCRVSRWRPPPTLTR